MTDIAATAQGVIVTSGVISPAITKVGDQYIMLYGALPGANRIEIRIATSSNGLTWTLGPSVITSANSPDWAAYRQVPITLMYENGQYELWFFGNNTNLVTDPGAGNGFGRATSENGIDWSFDSPPIRFDFDGPQGTGFQLQEVVKIGGMYHAYYMDRLSTGFIMKHAVSTDGARFEDAAIDIPVGYTLVAATTTTIDGSECVFAIWDDADGVKHYAVSTDGSVFTVQGIVNLPVGYSVSEIRIENEVIKFFGNVSIQGIDIGYASAPIPVISINQAPSIAPISITEGTINELPNATGSSIVDVDAGVISFADPNLHDRPTGSVVKKTVMYRDAHGEDVTGELTAAQTALIQNAFLIVPDPNNSNSGEIDWGYTVADSALDFLGVHETITLTSTVVINDGHGKSVDQDITVLINGANDIPIAAHDIVTTTRLAVAEGNVLGNDFDPDREDGAVLHVVKLNGLATLIGQPIETKYGVLTLDAKGHYMYAPKDKVDVTDVFAYSIDDGHGGTAEAMLAVTITKASVHQVALPFFGERSVSQGPNAGTHISFQKFSYDFNLPYDFTTRIGTEVLSVGDGIVVDMREYVANGIKPGSLLGGKADPNDPSVGSGGFGNYVTVRLDDGNLVTYMHLGHDQVSVQLGQEVHAGDLLGYTGPTGARSNPHLHIQFGSSTPYQSQGIAHDPLARANNVTNMIANGEGLKNAPEYFPEVTVHLARPYDDYNAGIGVDNILLRSPSDSGYVINGFQHDIDKIELLAVNFPGAATAEFLTGSQAAVTSDSPTFSFDTKKDQLLWDPDGIGSHAPTVLATLVGIDTFDRGDLWIV